MAKRALLLYSGGLDTSVMLKMLQEKLGMDVLTLTLDIGQEENDLKAISGKAWDLGATDVITEDVKKKFAAEYISREIKSDGLYGGIYPLSTSIARPLMSLEAVRFAEEYDCDLIVHGCTGKGNDQVRFEVSIKALNDDIEVIAPVRDWGLNRDQEVEFALANNIPVKQGGKYSTDENLWGRSVEGSDLENPAFPVPDDAYSWVVPPHLVREVKAEVQIGFSQGLPVTLNNEDLDIRHIVSRLNSISGQRGIGGIDYLEDRVTGIKSREFYECPAAVVLLAAHKALERITLNKEEMDIKKAMDAKWGDLVYNGLWFDPVMTHINAFEESVNEPITGEVRLILDKGLCSVAGIESQNSLYNFETSTYGKQDTFDQSMAKGFISIFGNQTVNTARVRNKKLERILSSKNQT
ncbi:argininosuccinate synthase [uncultured archaeon]|nr:argininosuccinate synthase [uncultured archaeon]